MVNANAAAIIMMSAHHRNRVGAPRRNSRAPNFVTKTMLIYTKGPSASILPNRAFNDTKILLPTRSLRHQPNEYYPPGSYGLRETTRTRARIHGCRHAWRFLIPASQLEGFDAGNRVQFDGETC